MSAFSRSFYYGKYSGLHHRAPPSTDQRCIATSPISLTTTTTISSDAQLAPSSDPVMHVQVSASGVTDPGRPGKTNQDAFFLLHDAPNEAMVLGVFDGHGRETGKDAALTAKAFFEAHFRSFTAAQYEALEADPHAVFTRLFRLCHDMIKSVFRGMYEQRGYRVQEIDGALVRKDRDDDDDDDGICIRGGTCTTVTVLLHGGRKILTANVGDSATLLGGRESMLSPNDIHMRTPVSRHSGAVSIPSQKQAADRVPYRFRDEIQKQSVVLTGNHSADNESEFLRVRKQSFGSLDTHVQFVYDCSRRSPSCSRSTNKKRLPVFSVSPRGLIQQSMVGDYYKNVRDEWATIVTTPLEAPFPDSLAFTRSLGDFHMHAFGVCHEPTVQEISLETVLSRHAKYQSITTRASPTTVDSVNEPTASSEASTTLFLVVASDGVWDNWKYDELVDFLVEHNTQASSSCEPQHGFRFWPTRSEPSATSNQPNHNYIHDRQSHVDRLTTELMEANLVRADRLFGDQADNMTAIVCRIECSHVRFAPIQ